MGQTKFLKELEKVGIDILMYGRFKDDIDMASVGLEKGTKFMDGKLVVDEEKNCETHYRSER